MTLFFGGKASYSRVMKKFWQWAVRRPIVGGLVPQGMISPVEKGPWGDGGGEGDGAPGPRGPRNPWSQPPRGPRAVDDGGPRPSALDELFKRGRGFGGGGGGSGLPKFGGGGRPLWLYGIALFVVLWLVFSSVHVLQPAEQGVVTRLGSFSRTVGSGVQFTMPAPFERMRVLDSQNIREVKIGSEQPNQENLVLTGDQNLIDLAYQVRWSIKDPELFVFQLAEPELTIREVAESAMRATVANFSLNSAFTTGRSDIEQEVQRRMQTILDQYRSGVRIDGIQLLQTDPPAQVDEAFKKVNAAKQQRESYQNDARAYAQEVLEQARGESAAFDKVYEQYRLAPEVTRRRMYYDTMEQVLGKVDKTIIEARGVTPYLALPELRRRAKASPEVSVTGEGGGQ